MTDSEVDRRHAAYRKNGWCPVRYAHHPQPIKDVIRRLGMRPQMKQCYSNCQRFVLYSARLGIDIGAVYYEGWVRGIIPFAHAWLVWEGQIVDLTLDDAQRARNYKYLSCTSYTLEEIRLAIVRSNSYGPVNYRRLSELRQHAIKDLGTNDEQKKQHPKENEEEEKEDAQRSTKESSAVG